MAELLTDTNIEIILKAGGGGNRYHNICQDLLNTTQFDTLPLTLDPKFVCKQC